SGEKARRRHVGQLADLCRQSEPTPHHKLARPAEPRTDATPGMHRRHARPCTDATPGHAPTPSRLALAPTPLLLALAPPRRQPRTAAPGPTPAQRASYEPLHPPGW